MDSVGHQSNDEIVVQQLAEMQLQLDRMSERLDALETEMRLATHRQAPVLDEMRREMIEMKTLVDGLGSLNDGGIPVEATQPPPRR